MKKPKASKEDESLHRLDMLHDAFVAIKLSEMEIRFGLDDWLEREEDAELCGGIVDLAFESEARSDQAEAALKRIADLRQKGEKWLSLWKKGH